MRTRLFLLGLFVCIHTILWAQPVSLSTARNVAIRFFQERLQMYRGEAPDPLSIVSEFTISGNTTACYFVFNIQPTGFVIVAADEAAFPVLGYSFTSHYEEGNQPAGFRSWMEGYINEILYIKDHHLLPDSAIIQEWEQFSVKPVPIRERERLLFVEPLITTKWSQDFPYNNYCPWENNIMPNYYYHVPAGCIATAMAQVMFYWRFPQQGQGSHCIDPEPLLYGPQCANFENTFYQYNGMVDSVWQENDPVALLTYHAGIAVDMTYTNQSSNAFFTKIPDAMRNYFRYSSSIVLMDRMNFTASQWTAYLKGDLDEKKPVLYSGGTGWNSHAFVCDGYQSGNYFHFNWGWGGLFDGYFLLTNLNPGTNNYTANQQAIMHIEPSVYIYPVYCNGQTVITEFSEGSIEDGSGPVKGYRNNNLCSWLILPYDSIQNISLRFNRFNTASGDLVKVYDGFSASAPLLASYSGSGIPPQITSSGPSLFLTFESNATINENGFQAEFTSNPLDFCQSSTFITNLSGSLTDGSQGYMYHNNTSCQWLIIPFNPISTTLTFEEFSTEEGFDKLEIVELGTGVQLALLSGDYLVPPDPVTSSTGMMMIHYTTNKVNRGSGWYATYSVLVAEDETDPSGNWKIYPNPTDRFVTIDQQDAAAQDFTITLCSVIGNPILSRLEHREAGRLHVIMDLEGLSKGVYLIRIDSDPGTTIRKLVLY